MSRRLRLGRILGVDIAADRSWLLTFVLAASTIVSLGGRLLPALEVPALTLLGAAAALGLFVSLVLHEVAHGLAARACGVPVRELTLFSVGGITDVERAPASPRSEAIAAVVAPATNLGLGLLLGGAALVLGASPRMEAGASPWHLLVLLFAWLGAVNVGLAALNLLPAYPLDGGRLVRAALWRITGDVERATRWSALLGQMIGWTAVLAGLGLALLGGALSTVLALWVAFVGWFLASAAAQGYQSVLVDSAFAGVTVGRIMRNARRMETLSTDDARPRVTPDTPAVAAYRTMADAGAEHLLVVEQGRLLGLLERADLERWLRASLEDGKLAPGDGLSTR
jgi:Zn-dependent protease